MQEVSNPRARIISSICGFALTLAACSGPLESAVMAALPTVAPPTALRAMVQPTPLPTPTESPAAPTPTPAPQHRIGVRVVNGDGEFFDRTTGKKFVPRGYNYVRLAPMQGAIGGQWHSTLNSGFYDAARADQALRMMHGAGYNVVRIAVDCCRKSSNAGYPAGGISHAYVDNIVDFLKKAKANDLLVLLILDLTPADGNYNELWKQCCSLFDGQNIRYLSAGGHQAKQRYDQDLIRTLISKNAPLDAIFAYDLTGEVSFDADKAPLNQTAGLVTTANDRTYDMAKPEDKQRMMDENLVYWIDQQRAAILGVDPTALITVSFFWPQQPHPARVGDPRLIRTYPAIAESSADFIDLHPYLDQQLTLSQYVDNFEMPGLTRKPIIMGEYGVSHSAYSTAAAAGQALQDWQIGSCQYGFDGWLLWTWDTVEQAPAFWTGIEEDGTINRWLAPANRPDPCAQGTQISQSADPAAPAGSHQVVGRLTDARGQPFSTTLPIQFSVKPLDGPGVFGIYTLSDVVPAGVTEAVVGLRINLECNCQGSGDVALYKASFVQGEDPANRVPDGDFAAGIGSWGHDPATIRLEASDRGSGRMLHITASPSQSVMLNSAKFPVVAGEKFTWTMEARVAPGSVGSGYWGLFLLGATGEGGRKKIPLEPAAFSTGEIGADADGAFQFTLSGLPAGTFLIEAYYPGDDQHLPGRATFKMQR